MLSASSPLTGRVSSGGGGADAPLAPSETLSTQTLRDLPDSQVVSFLLQTSRFLRGATAASLAVIASATGGGNDSSASTHSNSDGSGGLSATAPAPTPAAIAAGVDRLSSFVKALLASSRYTRSASADVAQLAACILCDAIRLHTVASAAGAAAAAAVGAASTSSKEKTKQQQQRTTTTTMMMLATGLHPLPFPSSSAMAALRVIAQPFRHVCEAGERMAAAAAAAPSANKNGSTHGNAVSGRGAANLHRCSFVIERAAATRALAHLLPHCLSGLSGASNEKESREVEAIIQCFFSSVEYASSGPSSSSPSPATSTNNSAGGSASILSFMGGKATAATAATAVPSSSSSSSSQPSEMARILGDILGATNAVTEEQLAPLLRELIAASATLSGGGGGGATGAAKSGRSASGGVGVGVVSAPGAAIASRVFLEQIDVLQPAVASVALEHLEQGTEKLAAAEFHTSSSSGRGPTTATTTSARPSGTNANNSDEDEDEDDDEDGERGNVGRQITRTTTTAPLSAAAERLEAQRRRRPALRDISRALEIFTALMELNVNLCAQLVPGLVPYLSHNLADVRLLLFRGFAAAWTSNREAFHAYSGAFTAALHRFNDVKPALRLEAVESVARIMTSTAGGGERQWPTAVVAETWAALRPCLELRLTDPHVSVRAAAVQTYADVLAAMPDLASGPHDSPSNDTDTNMDDEEEGTTIIAGGDRGNSSGRPRGLAGSLGLRAADKNPRVRERAVVRLCALYREHPSFDWIPDCVMHCVNAEGGVALVELELESMLPPPTLRPGGNNHNHSAPSSGRPSAGTNSNKHTTSLALFDFEKEEVRQGRSYVDAVVHLCRDLRHRSSYTQLLAITRKKPQLRLAISRLFELRAEVKAMADPQQSPSGATVITSIQRLLAFLQDITRAEKGEWDALFRAKDDRVARALQGACYLRNTNWRAERDGMLAALKGRLEPEVYRFVAGPLAKQMALPFDLGHLTELLGKVGEAFTMTALQARHARRCQRQERHNNGSAEEDDDESERHAGALLQALLLFVSASPSFFPRCIQTLLRALEAVTQAAAATSSSRSSGAAQPLVSVCTADTLLLLLQCIREWSAYEAANNSSSSSSNDADTGGEEEAEPVTSPTTVTSLTSRHGGSSSSTTAAGGSIVPPAAAAVTAASLSKLQKHDVLSTLGQLCLGGRAALNIALPRVAATITTSLNDRVCAEALAAIAGTAAQTFLSLIAIPSFGEVRALSRLAETIAAQLQQRRAALPDDVEGEGVSARRTGGGAAAAAAKKGGKKATAAAGKRAKTTATDGNDDTDENAPGSRIRVVAWLQAVGALAEDRLSASLVQDETLVAAVAGLLFAATVDTSDHHAEHDRLTVRRGATLADRQRQLDGCVSAASATVRAAAAALVAVAQGYGADRRLAAVSATLDSLLHAYKLTASKGPGLGTVGACQRRLAIDTQLARMLAQPSADIGKELAAAVIFSAEDEDVVLSAVQQELTDGLLGIRSSPSSSSLASFSASTVSAVPTGGVCDMRYAAFLLLTAMGCENKTTYAALKSRVALVGDHLRRRQAATKATLSDPSALQCYLEYTAPFLILFMSHHSFYEVERTANNFIGFQRVWHLLLEELFRHGTHCASFLVELLGRIKASDDALDRSSDAHRVVCDLASRVMLQLLGHRQQSSADSLRRFPGAVLLPNFFARTARPNPQILLDTVYLDKSVQVAAAAPFRVPVAAATAAGGGGGGGGSRGASLSRGATPRQSVGRAPSQQQQQVSGGGPRMQLNEAEAEEEEGEMTPYGRLTENTPASAAKRPRARSASSPSSDAASSPHASSSAAKNTNANSRRRLEATATGQDDDDEDDNDGETGGANTRVTQAQRRGVAAVLNALLGGLRQSQIAKLRWKAVKGRIDEEVIASGSGSGGKEATEAILDHAREQLRVRYESADP